MPPAENQFGALPLCGPAWQNGPGIGWHELTHSETMFSVDGRASLFARRKGYYPQTMREAFRENC